MKFKKITKDRFKRILFYVVVVVLGIFLYMMMIDGITNYRYQSVVTDKLGKDYVIVECKSVGETGVRLCYASNLDTDSDIEGYAVRLSKDYMKDKRAMTYDAFKGVGD